ncbi:MAG: hypothetical protein ABI401_05730 [Candidatus Dormibacter sp.]
MARDRSWPVDTVGSWRPGDAQLGWIIENRLDEAYVLSWPGQLETYIPLHDTGGYDRGRAPIGSYDWRLDQVKGTARLHSGNQVQIAFGTPALHPRRHVDFTFLYYDLRTRELLDPAWLVSSLKLDEVCVPQNGSQGRRVFTARRSGLTRDAAARYQVAVRELAAARGWSLLPSKSRVAGVSTNPIETGAFFERHFDAAFLEVATGDEVLMAATPDNFGRHRLAFSKQTGRWASIAIHGSTVTNSTKLIQANIHAATFSPNPRHYILVQHYDRRRAAWHPWSWLIPSTDFAHLARGKGPYLLFTTTLNPTHVNRWSPYRVATADAAAMWRNTLRSTARRAA